MFQCNCRFKIVYFLPPADCNQSPSSIAINNLSRGAQFHFGFNFKKTSISFDVPWIGEDFEEVGAIKCFFQSIAVFVMRMCAINCTDLLQSSSKTGRADGEKFGEENLQKQKTLLGFSDSDQLCASEASRLWGRLRKRIQVKNILWHCIEFRNTTV